jgi:hypothetical protein
MEGFGHREIRAGGPQRRPRLALLLALLLSLFGQSLLTQTHVHVDPQARALSSSPHGAAPARVAHRHHSSHGSANCPICREIAQAGQYLPSVPPAAGPMGLAPLPVASPAAPGIAGRSRSHAWRSRGPPETLPA